MWAITESNFDPSTQAHRETIFTIGNGYLSTRGVFEEGYSGEHRATFVHGIFDDVPVVFTELANVPDWLSLQIKLDGESFSLHTGTILSYEIHLDLYAAVLTRTLRWQSPGGRRAIIKFERFASLADEHLLCLRCQVTPEFSGTIEFQTALNMNMDNEGMEHWKWVNQSVHLIPSSAKGTPVESVLGEQVATLHARTRSSGVDIAQAMRVVTDPQPNASAFWDVKSIPTFHLAYTAQPGKTITVDKLVGISTQRDIEIHHGHSPITASGVVELAVAHVCQTDSFVTARKAHEASWVKEWERSDVIIEGDDEAQLAMRFSLYHLLIAAPRKDKRVSIGAKTLSGFGYRGHAFWDTEIFMLPFFTYTAPHIARNLLDYRYMCLPAARLKAQESGYSGAWFAWESAATGEEVTPTWIPDFKDKKTLARVWTGDLAIHISADIAYGTYQYWRITGDDVWFCERGVELILETAQFYAARAEWNADLNAYIYSDVVGPDEYHDHVNNNAYTNRLAQWNIETGLQAFGWLQRQNPGKAAQLAEDLKLTTDKLAHWKKVAGAILGAIYPNRLIEQFDNYFKLVDVNLEDYEPRNQSMHQIFGIEGANRYQAIKQPDVVMLLFLLQNDYTEEIIRANYHYYNSRTDHTYGSSLGPPIQAIMACKLGYPEEAYTHFIRTARADLHDVRGNAGDGIHGASAGGLWQAVVFGFAGLTYQTDGSWKVRPQLPAHWKRLAFKFFFRGEERVIDIQSDREAS